MTSELWELTEYDHMRKPQEIIINSEIAISPRSLHRELMCPICLDVLNKTLTTKDCLHRFCTACISKALRSGNKECPTCRKKLASLRCLRPDPNFDQLIAKIYTNREEKEKIQETPPRTVVPSSNCEVILRRLNDETRNSRFIKLPFESTIGHLVKYLEVRPERSVVPHNKEENYHLAMVADRSRGHYEKLDHNLKLKDIDAERPLELFYFKTCSNSAL